MSDSKGQYPLTLTNLSGIIAGMKAQALSSLHPFSCFVKNLEADEQCKAILFDFRQAHAMNANLLVFLLWFAAAQYGRLNKKELVILLQTVGHWHERVVLPLRRVATVSSSIKQASAIKDYVQEEAQFANQIEQQFLGEALVLRTRARSTAQQLADACHNLSLYCKQLKLHLDNRSKEQSVYLLQFVFPSQSQAAIKKACYTALQVLVNSDKLGAQLSLGEL